MTYTFDTIEDCNVEQVIDLFIDTFTRAPWFDVYESREQVERFFARFRADNYFLGYILWDQNQPIALSMGTKKPWIEGMEYVIDQFCVAPAYQGQKVGTYFLTQIEQEIIKMGLNAILLNTDKGVPAEAFYRKAGFRSLDQNLLLVKLL